MLKKECIPNTRNIRVSCCGLYRGFLFSTKEAMKSETTFLLTEVEIVLTDLSLKFFKSSSSISNLAVTCSIFAVDNFL